MSSLLRRGPIVLLVWGLWLWGLASIQAAFDPQPFVAVFIAPLLGGAGLASMATGAALLVVEVLRRRREDPLSARVGESAAAATIVVGLALALVGANFGLWAAYVGGGTIIVGLGGVIREERARRESLAIARRRYEATVGGAGGGGRAGGAGAGGGGGGASTAGQSGAPA